MAMLLCVWLIWLTDWFCSVWYYVVCAAVLFTLIGCCVSRALTVWCCSRQQVDLDVRQHIPPTLWPSAPFHPAGRGASAAGSGRQHHGAQHALTWHLAPGSPNTPPTLWPHAWLPKHPANTLTSHLAPRTPRPRTWLPRHPANTLTSHLAPGQPANTPTSHLAPRTPHQHPDLAPGSPDTPPTPCPLTWLPAHPANTLTSHLAPRTPHQHHGALHALTSYQTPRQHPDLAPGSPDTQATNCGMFPFQSGLCLFSLQFSGPCSWWWAWWDRQLAVSLQFSDTKLVICSERSWWHPVWLFVQWGLVTQLFVQ